MQHPELPQSGLAGSSHDTTGVGARVGVVVGVGVAVAVGVWVADAVGVAVAVDVGVGLGTGSGGHETCSSRNDAAIANLTGSQFRRIRQRHYLP